MEKSSLKVLAFLAGGLVTGALASGPVGPRATDLGTVLPADPHVAALVNVKTLVRDLPVALKQSWVGKKVAEMVAKGWPDPTELARAVGVGVSFSGRTPREVVLVTDGRLRIVPAAKAVAGAAGVGLDEKAYHGVTFHSASVPALSVSVADVTEDVSFFAWDVEGKHESGPWVVDTIEGARRSFSAAHGVSLSPETYVIGGANVPLVGNREAQVAAMAGLEEATGIEGLKFLVQGAFAWKRQGGRVTLGSELQTFTGTEAQLLANGLRKALEKLKAAVTEPKVRWLLDHVVVNQEGIHVQLKLDVEWLRAREALTLLALAAEPAD